MTNLEQSNDQTLIDIRNEAIHTNKLFEKFIFHMATAFCIPYMTLFIPGLIMSLSELKSNIKSETMLNSHMLPLTKRTHPKRSCSLE